MRILLYAGLGFIIGYFATSIPYLLLFYGTPLVNLGFLIQIIGIVAGSIWGSRGLPIGGFRLPGIKVDE